MEISFKILTKQTQQCVKRIIEHITHVGFIPGMERWFNNQKLITVILHMTKLKKKKSYDCNKRIWVNRKNEVGAFSKMVLNSDKHFSSEALIFPFFFA